MKNRMRTFRLAAVAAAIAILATGCTVPSASSGSSGGSSSGSSGSGGTTTLTFWEYYQGTQLTWLQGQVAKFEKANPKVKIQLVQVVGAEQDSKLLASVSTGSTPDLLINNIVVDFPTLVSGKVLLNLTKYWDAYSDKNQFPSSAVWKNDGKVYNLMSYTNLLGMYYNKTALAASGISSPPTTIAQLQSDLAKVKATGKYQGIALSGAPTVEGAWLFFPQMLGQGVNYCNISSSKESSKVDAAFDRAAEWAKQGYTPQATATWDQNASWQQFSTGKYAFAFNGNWQLGNVKTAGFPYGTAEFPAPSGGTSKVFPGGEGFGIGAKSKHPDLAWKFIEQAILSKQGGESVFEDAGSIPVRADVANIPAIKNDKYVQPFVKAAQTTAHWPNNENTANMQTALGKAVSAVISGQMTASQGAEQAQSTIKAAIKSGGGGC